MEFRWRCSPSAGHRQGTAHGRRPLREKRVWFARTLQSLMKGAKADGPSVILNADDTDPASRQAAIYVNTQANGDPARRDAGPISDV
jgi:hypothetical protein